MSLGRVRIAVGILAALTAVVAAVAALGSAGRASAPIPLTPLALSTTVTSSASRAAPTSAAARRQASDINYLRSQWLDAEQRIRAAGAATSQQEQQGILAKNGPAITAALNQEVAAIGDQDHRIAALRWPASMKTDIGAFGSSSAAALNQLRIAASNPFGYDAAQVNAAIATFNTAANAVRHDLGLPPD
ncbi:MAG TPA: hypothetical protein VH112_04405 [Acidimicrobiales bacterium]|nr:hypothetical protein [Acidimicrobiales bacterium]